MTDDRKPNPGGTGMVVAGLLAVFVGLWMVAQTVTTEGETIKNKLQDLTAEIEVLHMEVKEIGDKLDRGREGAAPAPGEAAAAPAEGAPASAAK